MSKPKLRFMVIFKKKAVSINNNALVAGAVLDRCHAPNDGGGKMSANKSSNTTSRIDRDSPSGDREFVGIARKLGIMLPASLLLLTNMTASATVNALGTPGETKASAVQERLRANEVAEQLLAYTKGQVKIAAGCEGIHTNTPGINVHNPNVTNNGQHLARIMQPMLTDVA
jgi:hypothetical protein